MNTLPRELKDAIERIENGGLLFREDDTPITPINWYKTEKGTWTHDPIEPDPPLIKISLIEYLEQCEAKGPSHQHYESLSEGGINDYPLGYVFGCLKILSDLTNMTLAEVLKDSDYTPTIITPNTPNTP